VAVVPSGPNWTLPPTIPIKKSILRDFPRKWRMTGSTFASLTVWSTVL
jgi:hypothetical protein